MTTQPCPRCLGTGEREASEHDGTPTTLPCDLCQGSREVSAAVAAEELGEAPRAQLLDIDDLTYFARPELSQSGMKLLLRPGGPARFLYRQSHPQPPKAEFDFGHAAHALITGKGAPIAVIPDDMLGANGTTATREAKAFIAEARERGETPMKQATFDTVQQMVGQIASNPLAYSIITHPEAQTEQAIIGEIEGIPVRGKVDFLLPDRIADYKTTASNADVETFSRDAFKWGYDVQAAVYTELIHQAIGEVLPFSFIVQEKRPPYLVNVVRLSDEYLEIGQQRASKALAIFRECTESGTWPGYPSAEAEVEPPPWAYDDDIEIEIPEE